MMGVMGMAWLAGAVGAWAGTSGLVIHARGGAEDFALRGPEAGQQLVVMAGQNDVTREASFVVLPAEVAVVDETGYVMPRTDGTAVITASLEGVGEARIEVRVEETARPQPVSFVNDVVPLLTRNHCNTGACHAKVSGQNGFQLSLLGYEPGADFEQLVREGRGRRVFPAAPESSLLLMKASGEIPHEGGARLERESADYRLLRRWIEAGMPFDPEKEAVVERIEVFPRRVVAGAGARQQLVVTAHFRDGTARDITRTAQYESNQPGMAGVDERGLVTLAQVSGSTSVLVRFQEHVNVFQATIPLGREVAELPAPRNFIDEHIFAQLRLLGLPPSEDCGDGVFLRRVTLDIAGRLPTLEETGAFLAETGEDKREKKIGELLETVAYAEHFAGKWAALLRNKVERNSEWATRDSHAFHSWIRTSILSNKPFDQFAGELILASGQAIENPAVSWYRVVPDIKERMQDIAQVFLGVRMQCAQCHHHPYERWSQDDYYSFAAFFSTVERKGRPKLPEEDVFYHSGKAAGMMNPVTEQVMKPRLLGSAEPVSLPLETDPRGELAKWLSAEDNPYFARVLVNRYWKHFMGRGLVEPEDDIRPTNPATHPELLDALAVYFVKSGYDLKELVRTICMSRTYQLSSIPTGENGDDEQNYARYYPRRLAAEVLLDAVNDVTGTVNSFSDLPEGVRAIGLPNDKANRESEFLTMFGRPQMDTACECERSGEANLGQSLHLINSDLIQAKLGAAGGRAAELAKQVERGDAERLDELYLRALSRLPDEEERRFAEAHLRKKRELSAADPQALSLAKAEQEAFEDILWVLLNTKEFMFQH